MVAFLGGIVVEEIHALDEFHWIINKGSVSSEVPGFRVSIFPAFKGLKLPIN